MARDGQLQLAPRSPGKPSLASSLWSDDNLALGRVAIRHDVR